jgi:hypothetical protein
MSNTPRPLQEMSREDCVAELTVAKEGGIAVPEFSLEMGVTALRKLVKEARTTLPEDPAPGAAPEAPEAPQAPEVPETTPEAPEPPAQPETVPEVSVRDFSGPVTVICKNGKPTRVYSKQQHGAQYLTLAKNYAEANDGTLL